MSLSECVGSERTELLAELAPEPWSAATLPTTATLMLTQRQTMSVSS
jgi:hypothetical protein